MAKKGYIYLITNKLNGKQYVGQTSRDIWTRFAEHCQNSHNTYIGNAINKYGHNNFKLEELEAVDLELLDERERYWIEYYDTYKNGYNKTAGGNTIFTNYKHLLIVEKNLIVDSIEEFGRLAQEQVGWKLKFIAAKIKEVIDTEDTFLDYHFKSIEGSCELADEDVVKDWIQTLQIRFSGKHIYCFELKKEFSTIAECAKYMLENGLSTTTSKTPLQALVTSIGKQLHGESEYINSTQGNLTFCFLPGTTKNAGGDKPYAKTKVYCPQIDKEFDSQKEAAEYMVENQIWKGIKVKTAKLRISDLVNGYFPNYKGYNFEYRK